MKSLLVILFLSLFMTAYTAAIEISIGPQITFQNKEFNTNPCKEGWESSWVDLNIDTTITQSFKCKVIPLMKDEIGYQYENSSKELEFYYKNEALLNRLVVSSIGDVTFKQYPAIANGYASYLAAQNTPNVVEVDEEGTGADASASLEEVEFNLDDGDSDIQWRGGTAFILDEIDDLVWKWDAELEYWQDLSEDIAMPSGEYNMIFSLYNTPILSIENGENAGLWHLNLSDKKLSDIPLGEIAVEPTVNGYMQLFADEIDKNYKLYWLATDRPIVNLNIDSRTHEFIKTVSNEFGSLSIFLDQTAENVLLWIDGSSKKQLDLPSEAEFLKGCYESYPKAFCLFHLEDNTDVLYEIVDGNFRADTKLYIPNSTGTINPIASEVYDIVSMGGKRYFTIIHPTLFGPVVSLYVADLDSSQFVASYKINDSSDHYFLEKSAQSGVINWIGILKDEISITKITHSGEQDFVENNPSGVTLDGRDGEVEEKNTPRAEIAGHFSLGILSFMLLLCLRKPNRSRQ